MQAAPDQPEAQLVQLILVHQLQAVKRQVTQVF